MKDTAEQTDDERTTAAYMRLGSLSREHPIPGLLWSSGSDQEGRVVEYAPLKPLPDVRDHWCWLHFNIANQRAADLLAALPELPDKALKVLVDGEEFQQLYVEGRFYFGMIADLCRGLDETHDEFGFLHFLAGPGLLITTRRPPLSAVQRARERFRAGRRAPTEIAALEVVLEQAVEGFDELLDRLVANIDELEDQIITGSLKGVRQRLAEIRRTRVRLSRHVSGLRTLLRRLERTQDREPGLVQGAMLVPSRLMQRVDQIDHDVMGLGERTRLLQDEVVALRTEETNRHLRVLSILTIVFLPPTFIAGLFGMNLKDIPFGESGAGFWWGTGIAAVSAFVVLWLMKRIGILSPESGGQE